VGEWVHREEREGREEQINRVAGETRPGAY
jgi:hypothetical protein